MNTPNKFFMTENDVVDKMLPKIGHLAFSVYSVLKRYMNTGTNQCFPSIDKIAKTCGCNRNGAVKAIKILELNKMIFVGRSYNKPNIYTITSRSHWGMDEIDLAGVIMNCPDCAVPAVYSKAKYICPKCFMDVSAYVESVFKLSFPTLRKSDIYNDRKTSHHDYLYPDQYYVDILKNGEKPIAPPDYQTKEVFIDFSN